ncbi:MAG: FixH family protein [Cypionkella sp.]|jgi:nitrogen fixation protein FixH
MRELKGYHVLGGFVAAFGLIIGVNLTMAYKAISTFPGLEVDNSYVASQSFDADMKAQKALGWTLTPSYDGKASSLDLAFTDAKGTPVTVKDLTVLVGRPTEAKDDMTPRFIREAGVYRAVAQLHPGKWMLHVEAHAEDGTLFRQRLNIFVRG